MLGDHGVGETRPAAHAEDAPREQPRRVYEIAGDEHPHHRGGNRPFAHDHVDGAGGGRLVHVVAVARREAQDASTRVDGGDGPERRPGPRGEEVDVVDGELGHVGAGREGDGLPVRGHRPGGQRDGRAAVELRVHPHDREPVAAGHERERAGEVRCGHGCARGNLVVRGDDAEHPERGVGVGRRCLRQVAVQERLGQARELDVLHAVAHGHEVARDEVLRRAQVLLRLGHLVGRGADFDAGVHVGHDHGRERDHDAHGDHQFDEREAGLAWRALHGENPLGQRRMLLRWSLCR